MVKLAQDPSEPTEPSSDQERLTQIIDQAGAQFARDMERLAATKNLPKDLSSSTRDTIKKEQALHPREQGNEPGLTEDMRTRLLRQRNENDRSSGGGRAA